MTVPVVLPPSGLQTRFTSAVFQRKFLRDGPQLEVLEERETAEPNSCPLPRRDFLRAASAALAALATPALTHANSANEPLVFSPDGAEELTGGTPAQAAVQSLRLGEIPQDFWYRPRELWLQRHGTQEQIRVVYWKDGQILPDGYWQACKLLRDVRANRMTTMDPMVLDILRGILGYYGAWRWNYPLVVTSGFRTLQTNGSTEGAARNSMHLYGRATDLYMPGIPARDIAALGLHLKQGGVGFYPSRGFTHLDTGRLRVWRG